MTQVAQPVAPPLPPHDKEKCPFCPVQTKKQDKTSYIGKDNDSKKLGDNLESAKDPKEDHLYVDSDHGMYSAEAHHAICGNEVLKKEGRLEKLLIEQGKTTSQEKAGQLKPNDVGYDVNGAKNGIWLPSVPYMYMAGKKSPTKWWGDQKSWNSKHPNEKKRKSLAQDIKEDIAFTVMAEVKLQFHKGSHGSVGEPHNNYVVMAIKRLRQISVLVENFSETCPMEKGKPKTDPPFYPPYGLVGMLNSLSVALKRELRGAPQTWKYFISNFALECASHWKSKGK
jgi:hypothetical protein